ncbi:BLUF domain-containing protein [uncultured Tateyamaria sp.]|uniref:BLUF domain-containing protein n=1 Tax=uncultured Tateyamaria sp. TaxID=455651 RepID=UPI00262683B1|nr:BLUF domain-containing protein [uncultured Tateyamaria sp.]
MIRHVYTSLSLGPLNPSALSDILNTARRNNARDGLTGMLIYHNDRFLQVLEGPDAAVEDCLRRIEVDERHRRMRPLLSEQVTERLFTRWRMGFCDIKELSPEARESVFALTRLVEVSANGAVPDARLDAILRSFLLSVGATKLVPPA